ncbi:MAG TPA: secretin N-terminal domain-containing protein [Steroidobacteraceae bacterium]
MRTVLIVCSVMLVLSGIDRGDAAGSTETASAESSRDIDLVNLIEQAAPRLNKRFILDPRVQGRVTVINLDPDRMSYADLQAILSVHGFVATEERNGTVRIVPDANARRLPMPVFDEDGKRIGEEELVTERIDVGSLNAGSLVPILRPMLPQNAHMVAHPETNSLIVVASHANVRRIEAIVRELQVRSKTVSDGKAR